MRLGLWMYECVDVLPVVLVAHLKVVLEPACAPATGRAPCFPNINIDGAVLEMDNLHVCLVVPPGWGGIHPYYVRASGLGHFDKVTAVALKEAQKQEDLVGFGAILMRLHRHIRTCEEGCTLLPTP